MRQIWDTNYLRSSDTGMKLTPSDSNKDVNVRISDYSWFTSNKTGSSGIDGHRVREEIILEFQTILLMKWEK